jgi:hypothetical protein
VATRDDAQDFVVELREINVTPHVAQNNNGRRSAIDGRTTRHPGCHFPKSTSAPTIEISRFTLPNSTAILVKVVCRNRRFAKGGCNLAQRESRPRSMWCSIPRRPAEARSARP